MTSDVTGSDLFADRGQNYNTPSGVVGICSGSPSNTAICHSAVGSKKIQSFMATNNKAAAAADNSTSSTNNNPIK